jgi:hypothetical protein
MKKLVIMFPLFMMFVGCSDFKYMTRNSAEQTANMIRTQNICENSVKVASGTRSQNPIKEIKKGFNNLKGVINGKSR